MYADGRTIGDMNRSSSTSHGPRHTATALFTGVLTFTAGVVDVNTIYAGNQALGPSTNSMPLLGVVNVNGPNAALVVNSSLILGNTTKAASVAAKRTADQLSKPAES